MTRAADTLAPEALNDSSFEGQVLRCRPQMLWIANRVLRSLEAAQEVVQEAILRALRAQRSGRGAFDPARGAKLSSWLCTIARNAAIDLWRSRQRVQRAELAQKDEDDHRVDDAEASPTCARPFLSQDTRLLACQVLDRMHSALPPRDAAIVHAITMEGRTFQDVAKEMSMPASSLKTAFYRACNVLRDDLSTKRPVEQTTPSAPTHAPMAWRSELKVPVLTRMALRAATSAQCREGRLVAKEAKRRAKLEWRAYIRERRARRRDDELAALARVRVAADRLAEERRAGQAEQQAARRAWRIEVSERKAMAREAAQAQKALPAEPGGGMNSGTRRPLRGHDSSGCGVLEQPENRTPTLPDIGIDGLHVEAIEADQERARVVRRERRDLRRSLREGMRLDHAHEAAIRENQRRLLLEKRSRERIVASLVPPNATVLERLAADWQLRHGYLRAFSARLG
jgi:RNA polymerase sigma factor (sigma-70 family)